jgi:hypothetical protein
MYDEIVCANFMVKLFAECALVALNQIQKAKSIWTGESGNRTRDLSHPKRELYH